MLTIRGQNKLLSSLYRESPLLRSYTEANVLLYDVKFAANVYSCEFHISYYAVIMHFLSISLVIFFNTLSVLLENCA